MTKQTWTAFVAAVVFVGLAAMVAMIPVPFVSWSPGGTQDTLGSFKGAPIIKIEGTKSYPTTGRLDLTTVSVTSADARLSLPQALFSYWMPHRDALPRDSVYAPDKSPQQLDDEESGMMTSAQDNAVVAALRAAGQPVTELPAVSSVTVGGPAHGRLLPGDLVVSVDGVKTRGREAVLKQIRTRKVGQPVDFVVLRDRVRTSVTVTATESTTEPDVSVVGISIGLGYRYRPRITFDLGQEIGGPSAGFVFALAIYDKITDGTLLQASHVAGTGSISPDGQVGRIGGIQEKIAAADKAKATAFLVPAGNCEDLAGVKTNLTLIKVTTLKEGINAIHTLELPGGAARTSHC